ncbi:MAG: serine/threonine-protein phosphatase [Phycisphaerales bacterium]|nr:serine/threonine-protein phosphatase [Phycisphaerae bacterium]NNF42332.1 serine/threonine-protein phosphatase [Phycisphaerales bacterium]NNM26561.1 serine/threonine-protein phosphatase [Phycisphaerales bacterium]
MPDSAPLASCLVTRQNMSEPRRDRVPTGEVVTYSAKSPARDTDNEDAAAVIPLPGGRLVLAVADGVGGHVAGADASALAVGAIAESVSAAPADTADLRPAILNGIETANAQISDLGVGAATTVSVVEITGSALRPYHVGDSVILVVGQRGKLRLETVAHSPVGYALEAGLIDANEAMHHEDRHLVSNVVGSPDMRIEVGAVLRLHPRDTVVLGSDGLFDNLHRDEVIEMVRKGPLLKQAAAVSVLGRERMLDPDAGHPSKPDDLTFTLYRSVPTVS